MSCERCKELEGKLLYQDRIANSIEKELDEALKKNEKLKQSLIQIMHIANVYDGNFAKACDLITESASMALKQEAGE